MLIPHGDIVDAITPINVLLIGVANFDPSWRYIYIDGVITPINILFRGGGEF